METLLTYFDITTIFFTIGDYQMSYLEFFGTIFNITCVRLAARNNILNWPIGILWGILYLALFYQIQLYSDLVEQIYFLATGFYGWYVWTMLGKRNEQVTSIKGITSKEAGIYLVCIFIGTMLFAYMTQHLSIWFPVQFPEPASYVLLDAFTTVLSFAATILMIQKKVAAWYLWILVDIIGIWLYWVKWVKFISAEYVLFLFLAINGLISWSRIQKANHVACAHKAFL